MASEMERSCDREKGERERETEGEREEASYIRARNIEKGSPRSITK